MIGTNKVDLIILGHTNSSLQKVEKSKEIFAQTQKMTAEQEENFKKDVSSITFVEESTVSLELKPGQSISELIENLVKIVSDSGGCIDAVLVPSSFKDNYINPETRDIILVCKENLAKAKEGKKIVPVPLKTLVDFWVREMTTLEAGNN
jgi:hypothetical protein